MIDNNYQELKKQIKKDVRELLLEKLKDLNDVITFPNIPPYGNISNADMDYDRISRFAQKYIDTHRIDALKEHITKERIQW